MLICLLELLDDEVEVVQDEIEHDDEVEVEVLMVV